MPEPAGEIELLIAFLNTHNIEVGEDAIATPAELQGWLVSKGLLAPAETVQEDDVKLAQGLREGLRALLARDASSQPTDGLDIVLKHLPLRLTVMSGDRLALVPLSAQGTLHALGTLAALIATATAGTDWDRFKVCRNSRCQWAFYDASRNLSHTWCSMGACGNRIKARAYRSRRRGDSKP